MSLFALLGSGEFLPWTDEVDRFLLERTTGDGTVLILPTASAPEGDRVFNRWGDLGLAHLEEGGISSEVLPLKVREDAERPELVEKVIRSSVVYFSGGNPAHLAETLEGTPFWNAILDGLDRGLAYAGCSAGIACLGDVAPDSTSNDPTSAHFWRPGLGLFPKLYFGPHWDALDVHVPGLRASIVAAIPHDCRLLAIDEDTAVVGDGTDWHIFGKGGAAIMEAGKWTEFPSGASFTAHLEHHPPRS
ncbi:MAG: Type 1 glutamine amidotransferase-like domain-containing protein [Actinomycetota bacterium]|nr:Type 1 glutamine amidotransferase-like domain-containing protein [Actinomycetota bacterium]